MVDIDYAKDFDTEEIVDVAVKNTEDAKPKRKPYATWNVDGEEYKLKLTAQDIIKLEQRYKRNLLLYLTDDGIPSVADMLAVIHGAMRTYHHGMKYVDVQSLFDKYVDEGGDQTILMADVLMPLLSVSGFFTQDQAETIAQDLKNLDTNI